MNIEEFKARLGAGGARPNQFGVKLGFPLMLLVLIHLTVCL